MRVSLDCHHSKWGDKPGMSCAPHAEEGTPSRERGPQGAAKILQEAHTCLVTLLKLTSYGCWTSTHLSVFFPGVLRKVAVVQGPKLPWYFAFIKTKNTVISVETGTSPHRKKALFDMLFSTFFVENHYMTTKQYLSNIFTADLINAFYLEENFLFSLY